jgi:GT2 family glycosyltransferase
MANWHIPHFLRGLLPRLVIHSLREFKRIVFSSLRELKFTGRVLPPHFPRDKEFEQSPDDSQASACMSIVVPIHDAPTVTRRCLGSLEKYAPESEIILVDDASSLTETLEVIRHFSSQNKWKVVRHEKSLGHSEACREGANLATRPYLCLLNSDTVVTPWCWRPVKEVFEHDQKTGVAGPSTSESGNVQTLTLATVLSSSWNDNQICSFAKHLLTRCREPVVMDVAWVSGFALFIRRSLWEQVGGFDQNLPDYGNDMELRSRIAEKGYRMVWVRNSYIHHFGHQSYRDTVGNEGIQVLARAAIIYIRQKNHRRSHENV